MKVGSRVLKELCCYFHVGGHFRTQDDGGISHNFKTRGFIIVQDAMRSVTQEEPAEIPTQA